MGRRKSNIQPNAEHGAAVRQLLRKGPRTWREIQDSTGICTKGVYRWLRRLGATRTAGDARWSLPS